MRESDADIRALLALLDEAREALEGWANYYGGNWLFDDRKATLLEATRDVLARFAAPEEPGEPAR